MACVASPARLSHPASYAGLLTPPLSPLSPCRDATSNALPQVLNSTPSYAMLRQHHVYALKNTIARLRWDQVNNLYIPGQDAWLNHIEMIRKLEKELHDVEEAQKGLDQFPNCFAPISFPKPHGPHTEEEALKHDKIEIDKQRLLDAKLEEHFPFLKKIMIGPLTKLQAKKDEILRENLMDGDLEDLSILLPSENMRVFLADQQKKQAGQANKKSYAQKRYEKEKTKVDAYLKKHDIAPVDEDKPQRPEEKAQRIGPLTKEEWMSTLPVFGPRTYEQTMLLEQREQRHHILRWLQRPWGQYNEKAADIMEGLAEMARMGIEEDKLMRIKLEKRKEDMIRAEMMKRMAEAK